jgi:hypothetical protein
VFSWSTTDALSGVAKYLVKIGDGDWFNASQIAISGVSGEYQLPLQAAGQGTLLTVDAYDFAGNMTEATTAFSVSPLPTPIVLSYATSVTPSAPTFAISGSMPQEINPQPTTIHIYLHRSDGSVAAYSVPVGQDGDWSFSQAFDLLFGSFSFTVQASDVRGALSADTMPLAVAVSGRPGGILSHFLSREAAVIAGIVLLAGIAVAVFLLMRRRKI